MIDDVQNRVGPPLAHAVLDRGQVGRGVEKRAVLLLDDHRRVVAVEEHADRPVAFAREALCRQDPSRRRAAGPDKNSRRACGRTSRRAAGRSTSISARQAGRNSRHSSTLVGSPPCRRAVSSSTCWPMSACCGGELAQAADRPRSLRALFRKLGQLAAQFGQLRFRPARSRLAAFLALSDRRARRCASQPGQLLARRRRSVCSSAGIFSLRVSWYSTSEFTSL